LKVLLNVFSSTLGNKHLLNTWRKINCHYQQPLEAWVSCRWAISVSTSKKNTLHLQYKYLMSLG